MAGLARARCEDLGAPRLHPHTAPVQQGPRGLQALRVSRALRQMQSSLPTPHCPLPTILASLKGQDTEGFLQDVATGMA